MSRHLLVTNDFPPKVGGIQQYLWELWRRLDPQTFEVHTTPHADADAFDVDQLFRIHRSTEPFLLPYPWLTNRLDRAAEAFGATLHVIDPAVPLGLIGPSLDRPYVVVLHGAEVTVPGRLPGSKQALSHVLRNARGVISAGQYALDEAERAAGRRLESVVVPPGVDTERFHPIDSAARDSIRRRFSLPVDSPLILSVSRLVPRKGMDTLIKAAAQLRQTHPDVVVAIAGDGRDRRRLQGLVNELDAPVRLLGRVPEVDKPLLYGCADLFAMLCRNRWGGLEQEGFGIVFVEAAATGVPQVAGASGGAGEAVDDGNTGLIIDHDESIEQITARFAQLLDDDTRREAMGVASRQRAVDAFSYDVLVGRLETALESWT